MSFSGESGHLVIRSEINLLESEICEALSKDDKPAYLAALKRRLDISTDAEGPDDDKFKLLIPRVKQLCYYNSPKCASALLDWEINGSKVDLNAPFSDNTYLMHVVADRYSIVMLELMLKRGASANVRTFERNPEDGNDLLPLNVALDNLRFHIYLADWTPKDSVIKLIILLCLPQMRPILDFIKLLAINTDDTCVELIEYAEEGSLIQMAALLMADREDIMRRGAALLSFALPSYELNNDCEGWRKGLMWVRYELQTKIGSLFYEENNMKEDAESSRKIETCKSARITIISALRLLEVFERAGDAMDACRQIHRNTWVSKDMAARHGASLLRKTGFHLNEVDTDLNNIRWIEIDNGTTDQTKSEESIDDGSTVQTTLKESKSTNGFCPPLHSTRSKSFPGWVRTTFIPVHLPALNSQSRITSMFRLQYIPEYENIMSRLSEYKAIKIGMATKIGSQRRSSYSTLVLAVKKYARCRG